jgi:hypothetical protein
MNNVPILGRDEASQVFKRFLTLCDVPAYVRRARQVQEAFDELIARCQRQRAQWLETVRLRLGILHALAGDWTALAPYVSDETQLRCLQDMYGTLQPRLRVSIEPDLSRRKLRQALWELQQSIERFNDRWGSFLATLDLEHVNNLREGYNRYFVLEKECAVRSARVARQGFRPLPLLTIDDVALLLPPLAVPEMNE